MKEQDIWILMARAVFGEASTEELALLHAHLKDDPALQQQYELIANTLNNRHIQSSEEQKAAADDENLHVENIIHKANRLNREQQPKRFSIRHYITLAAASVLLIAITTWYFLYQKNDAGTKADNVVLTTHKGMRKEFTLTDGTKVWLNGDSKLIYANDFKGRTREVTLIGEAFFDVIKMPTRPFIVHAKNINIKVLGTAFNVKSYQEDENIETTLYRGLVNITKANDKTFQPILLYPNQKIIVPEKTAAVDEQEDEKHDLGNVAMTAIKKSIVIQQIDSNKVEPLRIETAWMYNRLEFKGASFKELALKLERWYNVNIIFEDNTVKQLSFTGSFEKENIEQALLALSTANYFNYKIKNNEIRISSKN
ncbi:MAG: FecR family protein [Niabella sp.]